MKLHKQTFYFNEFYKVADGYFSSFWVGKFLNKFIKKGQKHLIENRFKKTYFYTKLHLNKNFYYFLLEKIEKIKPIFKLKSKLIAGTLKEYPSIINQDRSRGYAITALYNSVLTRKEWYFEQRLLNEIVDLNKNIKAHQLILQKNENFSDAIKGRFNVRFGRPRIKRR